MYGGSEGLKTLLIEKRAPGGQAGTSSRIENYLGFPTGLSGLKCVIKKNSTDNEHLVAKKTPDTVPLRQFLSFLMQN